MPLNNFFFFFPKVQSFSVFPKNSSTHPRPSRAMTPFLLSAHVRLTVTLVAIVALTATASPHVCNGNTGQIIAFTDPAAAPVVQQFVTSEDTCLAEADCCCTAQGTFSGTVKVPHPPSP
jgi:hypothetical protein